MNLTLTQSFHRTQTLSGELKAAESALTDCEADAKAKERIASIAAEAVEKAKGHLETLRQEREELAEHMAALVRRTGEAIEPAAPVVFNDTGVEFPLDDSARNPDGTPYLGAAFGIGATADDQAARLMEHAESRVNGAFERATQ